MRDRDPTSRRRLLVVGASVAVMAAAGGFALGFARLASRPATQVMMVLPEPRPVAEFELRDSAGQPFSGDNLQGVWTLLFFGFTNCPDVCPSTLYDLDRIHGLLMNSGEETAAACRVVFVSVDPERDTPERLSDYVAYFNPEFRAATGSHQALGALTAQLGVAYRVEEHVDGAVHYDVAHSPNIVLIDPRKRLRGAFAPPFDAAMVARDIVGLITSER